MTPNQKLTAIKKLLTAAEIALIIRVPLPTVQSWTKTGKGARKPNKEHVAMIDGLYDNLKPCFESINLFICQQNWNKD